MTRELTPEIEKIRDEVAGLVQQIMDLASSPEEIVERLQAQTEVIDLLKNAFYHLGELRKIDTIEANTSGYSYADLAAALGVTRGRIQQLVTGVGTPVRVGVIEAEMMVEAAKMRSQGAGDKEVVETLVPQLRKRKSADRFSLAQIAKMLDVKESLVRPVLIRVDKDLRKQKIQR